MGPNPPPPPTKPFLPQPLLPVPVEQLLQALRFESVIMDLREGAFSVNPSESFHRHITVGACASSPPT